jgi:cation transport ATPase
MFEMQIMEHAHNFEISAALITIILLGKYIETLSKQKTVQKLA